MVSYPRKEADSMYNKEIRDAAKERKVKMWQIAEALGIQDSAFSRKLRHELPQEEKEKILAIIDRMDRERREAG